ncbi:glutamate receptor ionotropic, delta-1-like [Amphibalanus amphitrite]|uniref:glutamate receptor ionotropic, delta-1-like n=1 Tax=Amphibalanus amphitrite TaxID=1232801 RepID=UPI001C91FDB5|nr:glutamate receptor ionotropic, delta-1-like [Amphibalanus amphitrite]
MYFRKQTSQNGSKTFNLFCNQRQNDKHYAKMFHLPRPDHWFTGPSTPYSLNITLLEGYAYGKRRPDGTYTGMVGELQAGRADMTVSEVSFTNEREQVIDYTQTVSVISRRVYVHIPTVLDSWLARYSRGISAGMVALSLAAVVLLALTHRFCERILARAQEDGRREVLKDTDDGRMFLEVAEGEAGLADTLWIMLGLMLQQGADDSPSGLSSRVAFLSCLLLGLLLTTAYSATLISFLSSSGSPRPPFADLQGLTKMPDWSAGWKEGELIENVLDWCALRDNPMPDCHTLTAVWNGHVLPDKRNNLVQSYEEGFKKVARGNYAFIAPNEAADYQLSKMAPEIACRVHKLEVEYAPGGIALGLQNNSPYKELFDQSLQRLDEAGVTEKLYRSILRQREVCSPQLASAATLLQTLGAFLLLLAGMVSSGLMLLAERLHSRAKRRRDADRNHKLQIANPSIRRIPRTIHLQIKTWY